MGFAVWVLYFVPLMASLLSRRPITPMWTVGVIIVTMTLGFLVSLDGIAPPIAATNRAMAAAIVVAVALSHRRGNGLRRHQLHDEARGAFGPLGRHQAGATPASVLMVEDDPTQLEGLQARLSSEEVRTVGAPSANEALAAARAQAFDCTVLDMTLCPMPRASTCWSGWMPTRPAASLPVIIYTARSLPAAEEQRLRRYSRSIIKGAKSPERLIGEVTLFLLQVVSDLPTRQREMLEGRRILVVEDDIRNICAISCLLHGDHRSQKTGTKPVQVQKPSSCSSSLRRSSGAITMISGPIPRPLWRAELARERLDCATLSDLQHRLLQEPDILPEGIDAMTVQVSDLFRDPACCLALRREVIPHLATFPSLKVWVAGCADGERLSSLAILLREEGLLERTLFYAIEINPRALKRAEAGIYGADRIATFSQNDRAAGGRGALSNHYTAAHARDRRL